MASQQLMYECRLCNHKPFETVLAFNHHKRDKHPPQVGCKSCNKKFADGAALQQHMSDKHPIKHICEKCGASFKTDEGLKQHISTKHGSHPCKACQKSFFSAEALAQHKSTKHPTDKKTTSHPTVQHKQTNSIDDKHFNKIECPMSDKCRQVFTSTSELALHLESGACSCGMNRKQLDDIVSRYKIFRRLTRPAVDPEEYSYDEWSDEDNDRKDKTEPQASTNTLDDSSSYNEWSADEDDDAGLVKNMRGLYLGSNVAEGEAESSNSGW